MKRILCNIICIILCATCLVSCSTTEIEPTKSFDDYTIMPTEAYDGAAHKAKMETNFTVWSWQIPSVDLATQYAEKIKAFGFDGAEICVQWSNFEPKQNEFDWRWLDAVVEQFTSKGLTISLSVLFWTGDLEWKNVLTFQETSDSKIYEYDNIRGGSVCFNNVTNTAIIRNTIKNFAIHCMTTFGEHITRWHIRTNCFANMEYASIVDLDYSDSSMEAFISFLDKKFGINSFNKNYGTKFKSWDDARDMKKSKFTALCPYEWNLFKQNSIIEFTNMCCDTFKIACDEIPTVLQLGSFWDTAASYYRGVFDIYTISRNCHADIIQTNDSPAWPHDFSADLMTSTSSKLFGAEIDGAWRSEDEFSDYVVQAEQAGASGINYLSTVNWNLDDMEKYGEEYISKLSNAFKTAENRPEADETDVILINTLDFLFRQPPQDLYDLYYNAYKNIKGKSGRKVRFITDTQLAENPDLLNGIKKIHIGQLDDVVYMLVDVGNILADADISLIDDNNSLPNFVDQYGEPLEEKTQDKLRSMINS